MKQWIVLASRAETKVFEWDRIQNNLKWVTTLISKKDHKKDGESEIDRLNSPHGLFGKHSHIEIVEQQLSRKLGVFLKSGFESGFFEDVMIFADPKLLGRIKQEVKKYNVFNHAHFFSKNIEKANNQQIITSLGMTA